LRKVLNQLLSKHEISLDSLDINDLLLLNSVRKSFGVTPKHFDLYSDETEEALWRWELTSSTLYFESKALKKLNEDRAEIGLASAQIKLLHKLNNRIENAKSAKDITAVSTTHSKYLKAVQKANEAEAKIREK
jgi:hypothetical protein